MLPPSDLLPDALGRRPSRRLPAWLWVGLALWSAGAAVARGVDLAELSLEQLSEVVVTSVSRREEPLADVAASVFVISADDIRRSGATSLPEALRLAPALNVARADMSQYAISARGFNNLLANRMLVLIDGRTIYTPLFSGVFWDAQDLMLEDIDRIEVITGPSTAMWGSNAVNGLIHILTRRPQETQGSLVAAHAGNRERGLAVRHGGRGSGDGAWRLYAKSSDRSSTRRTDGRSSGDGAHRVQAGVRAGWHGEGRQLTLQGEVYRGTLDQQPGLRHVSGAHLLGRWRENLDRDTSLMARLYLERNRREQPVAYQDETDTFDETLDNADAVLQYTFSPARAHHATVGFGHRHTRDDVRNPRAFAFLPAQRTMNWSRLFAEDQIALGPATELTLGASLERNPYTGTEFLPSARLAWRDSEQALWWAGISRAVRAPSRIDRDYRVPAEPPYRYAGGPDFEAEVSDVYEIGRRAQPTAAWSYSVTAFHHEHRRLRSISPQAGGAVMDNNIEGRTRGLEAWGSWQAARHWKLSAGGVLLRQHLRVRPGRLDAGGLAALGNDPRHWWSLRSSLEVRRALSWDLALRHTGALPQPRLEAYTALDSHLAWRPRRELELSLSLRNLLDRGHAEWRQMRRPAAELGRTASLQLRWQL
ncbi:TonB-dependent receptor plug domain-containing protein [Eleftheria terrae]|uniref:TonB-dependent receptor plug domain-containing protein n=1 Tax=Eleftheria terrae TaxID=1597781 RepID=UPI00263B1C1C|nr:TonB-dependent receptor [Eleftheria terrae]WKB52089.1 TonB-dependent receptor [Eleftheria terrae]